MPKPINETIGSCPCSIRGCDLIAEVKKEKGRRARLYLVCKSHGVVNLSGKPFQEYILENATMNGPGGVKLLPESSKPPEKNTAVMEVPLSSKYESIVIEQGPAPEPYPHGVTLEQPKPKPKPAPAPARAGATPEPKPTEKTTTRPGIPGLRWLSEGLDEL